MTKIKEGDKVKYIGLSNRWTFKQDLEKNSIGKVIKVSEANGKTNYQVEFDNGITTSLEKSWEAIRRIYKAGIATKNATFQAGIFPENKASISLHLKNGFRILGIREKIGKMDQTWRDVAMLERRSKVAGKD